MPDALPAAAGGPRHHSARIAASTSIASQRWRSWTVTGLPVRSAVQGAIEKASPGTRRPSISGKVGWMWPASSPATNAPQIAVSAIPAIARPICAPNAPCPPRSCVSPNASQKSQA